MEDIFTGHKTAPEWFHTFAEGLRPEVCLHKIPLKKDVHLVNRKRRKYTRVIKDCNDLYHTDEWSVVQRCEIPCNYKRINASFEDGDRFLT